MEARSRKERVIPMNVIWREWYNESAVEAMTKLGTLPRNETDVGYEPGEFGFDGADAASEIAHQANREDPEAFRNGGEIVILEPPEWAGTYDIDVDYEPTFTAYAQD